MVLSSRARWFTLPPDRKASRCGCVDAGQPESGWEGCRRPVSHSCGVFRRIRLRCRLERYPCVRCFRSDSPRLVAVERLTTEFPIPTTVIRRLPLVRWALQPTAGMFSSATGGFSTPFGSTLTGLAPISHCPKRQPAGLRSSRGGAEEVDYHKRRKSRTARHSFRQLGVRLSVLCHAKATRLAPRRQAR